MTCGRRYEIGAGNDRLAQRARLARRFGQTTTMLGWALAAVLSLGAGTSIADETSPASTLDQALVAYRAAQETAVAAERPAAFARAERLFTAAAEQGPASADLWTNLGTAALQAEHLGTSVLAYRRALHLDPDHRRAQQNLAHARTLLPAWVPRPESGGFLDSFFAWQGRLAASERAGAAALCFLAAAALFAAAIATGSGALRLFGVGPLLAWGLLVASGLTHRGDTDAAVLVANDTVARAADSRNAPARFAEPLPAGTEVTIGETRGDWARIVLADGRDAWVSAGSLATIARGEAEAR
jgi:hypothetical protein